MDKHTLKELREGMDKSKMKVAQELNIPYTSYARYEEHLEKAPVHIAEKICSYYNVSIADVSY